MKSPVPCSPGWCLSLLVCGILQLRTVLSCLCSWKPSRHTNSPGSSIYFSWWSSWHTQKLPSSSCCCSGELQDSEPLESLCWFSYQRTVTQSGMERTKLQEGIPPSSPSPHVSRGGGGPTVWGPFWVDRSAPLLPWYPVPWHRFAQPQGRPCVLLFIQLCPIVLQR